MSPDSTSTDTSTDTSNAAAHDESAAVNEHGWPHKRVLVAVDDGDTSRHAARVARSLFGDLADSWVGNVGGPDVVLWRDMPLAWGVPYPVMLVGGAEGEVFGERVEVGASGPVETDSAQAAQETARHVADDVALPGATPLGTTGNPAEQIRKVADEHDVDVIVVGWHEKGWWERIFDPSVPKEILRHINRPVLVIP